MTTRLLSLLFVLISGWAVTSCSDADQDQPAPPVPPRVTTVYLVRHAEKDDNAANPSDPTLSAAGTARAQALSQQLANASLAALFTTNTARTRATLAPLAAATTLTPQVYDAQQPAAGLAGLIRQNYAGKSVLVVGHSNTVLPLIQALGATPPVPEIRESDYNYLFTVRIEEGATPTAAVTRYGN